MGVCGYMAPALQHANHWGLGLNEEQVSAAAAADAARRSADFLSLDNTQITYVQTERQLAILRKSLQGVECVAMSTTAMRSWRKGLGRDDGDCGLPLVTVQIAFSVGKGVADNISAFVLDLRCLVVCAIFTCPSSASTPVDIFLLNPRTQATLCA
jgi:hypothetical protein